MFLLVEVLSPTESHSLEQGVLSSVSRTELGPFYAETPSIWSLMGESVTVHSFEGFSTFKLRHQMKVTVWNTASCL